MSKVAKRKLWIKVPEGRDLFDQPSEGGVEHHMVSPIEPPVCCEDTPKPVDPADATGPLQCDPCGAKWWP
jgi:hypothetical protein